MLILGYIIAGIFVVGAGSAIKHPYPIGEGPAEVVQVEAAPSSTALASTLASAERPDKSSAPAAMLDRTVSLPVWK